MADLKEDISASAEWVSTALIDAGYRADFTPQSLLEIDRFFDEHIQDGAAKPGGLLSEDLGSRIFAVGSYMGEVVRRKMGGEWVGNDNDPQAEMNVELKLPDGTSCWPVQRAMKRFKNGTEEGIAAWGSGIGLPLDTIPKAPSTSLRSTGVCPWCRSRIEMRKEAGAFSCPVCNCRFRHNWTAWAIGIPLAVVIALAVFRLLHSGIFAAFSGAAVAVAIVSRWGLYRLLSEGRHAAPEEKVRARVPAKKESPWVIIFLALLLLAILLFAFSL